MSGDDDWKWYDYHNFYKQMTKNEKAGMSPQTAANEAAAYIDNKKSGNYNYGNQSTSTNAKGSGSCASKSSSSGKSK